jgi:hypothetical protein
MSVVPIVSDHVDRTPHTSKLFDRFPMRNKSSFEIPYFKLCPPWCWTQKDELDGNNKDEDVLTDFVISQNDDEEAAEEKGYIKSFSVWQGEVCLYSEVCTTQPTVVKCKTFMMWANMNIRSLIVKFEVHNMSKVKFTNESYTVKHGKKMKKQVHKFTSGYYVDGEKVNTFNIQYNRQLKQYEKVDEL